MKIITLWQPWATFIKLEWKKIETRPHDKFRSLFGQTIGIHAAKKWDNNWLKLTEGYLTNNQTLLIEEMKMNNEIPFGEILCTTYIWAYGLLYPGHSQQALISCNPEVEELRRYGLHMSDIKSFKDKIVVKGHQGIWEYEV